MQETATLVGIAAGLALLCAGIVGPVWLFRRLSRTTSRSLRGVVIAALALLVAIPAALDTRSVLYWREADRALAGVNPETIGARPVRDVVKSDPAFPHHVTRVVFWDDGWSGAGLGVEYDLRTGRRVRVWQSQSDGWVQAVNWCLHLAALTTCIGAIGAAVSRLRRRRKSEGAASQTTE